MAAATHEHDDDEEHDPQKQEDPDGLQPGGRSGLAGAGLGGVWTRIGQMLLPESRGRRRLRDISSFRCDHREKLRASLFGRLMDMPNAAPSTGALAFSATRHCLTGCAIGEVLGMVIGTSIGLGDLATVALAVALAFFFGYAFTFFPLLRGGMALRQAIAVALAADTISITVMEVVDNAVMLAVPGAMDAGAFDPFFWLTLAFALAVAFVVAFPVNVWLISRGLGHARVHHGHH